MALLGPGRAAGADAPLARQDGAHGVRIPPVSEVEARSHVVQTFFMSSLSTEDTGPRDDAWLRSRMQEERAARYIRSPFFTSGRLPGFSF